MPEKLTIEEVERRFNAVKYPELSIDLSTYKSYKEKCRFIDSEYGEWWACVANVIGKKCLHPMRRRVLVSLLKKTPIEDVIQKIYDVWGDIVSLDRESYYSKGYRCRFIDIEYGEFFTSIKHLLNGHGHRRRGILKHSATRILQIDDVKKRLLDVHGNDIVIIEETYIGMYKNATFVHIKYGEWQATPNNVITHKSSHPLGGKERAIETSLLKYGVKIPIQNEDIYKKVQKSLWNTVTLKHWKDGRDILCRASYEFAIINKLNEMKIDYSAQIKFILNNDIVYYCDLYLPNEDRYIEIKGRFWSERSKNKWIEFHKKFENSEIWYDKDVCNFVGKSIYRIKKDFRDYLKEINHEKVE